MSDPAKKVAPSNAPIPFVTFPGSEIKDLYVHEASAAELPTPPSQPAQATSAASKVESKSRNTQRDTRPARAEVIAPPVPPAAREEKPKHDQYRNQQQQHHHQQQQQQQQQPQQRREVPKDSKPTPSTVGTGSHLLRLRERKATGGQDAVVSTGEFNFEEGIKSFQKDDVSKEVDNDGGKKYVKDDFFDNLSNDVSEKGEGRKTRLTASEERQLNQDTFGAIALQSNYRRGGRGRGGRGSGGYGRGRGGGRGGGYNNNK